MAKGTYTAVEGGIDVGGLVRRALVLADISQKAACLEMCWDSASFSRALDGEAPLDLWKLSRLPYRFWVSFIPLFAQAHLVWFLSELKSDVQGIAK